MFKRFSTVFLLILLSNVAWGQTEQSVFEPTGLPDGDPGGVLPESPLLHIEWASGVETLKSLDALLQTFVPERVLPPQLAPVMEGAEPVLALIGIQTLGGPISSDQVGMFFGLDLQKPITFSWYMRDIQRGWILSLPVSNKEVLSNILVQSLVSVEMKKESVAGGSYYKLTNAHPDLPAEVCVASSEDRFYLCGGIAAVESLFEEGEKSRLKDDAFAMRALDQQGESDLKALLTFESVRPALNYFKQMYAVIPDDRVAFLRQSILSNIGDAQLSEINMRLKLQLGIRDIHQGMDYAEAVIKAGYEVLFDELHTTLSNVDGLALTADLDAEFQKVSFTFYSRDITKSSAKLPMSDILNALKQFPGPQSGISVVAGQGSTQKSTVAARLIAGIEENLKAKSLPLDIFENWKRFYDSQQAEQAMVNKVPWLIESTIGLSDLDHRKKAETLEDYSTLLAQAMAKIGTNNKVSIIPSVEKDFVLNHYKSLSERLTANRVGYEQFTEDLNAKQTFFAMRSRVVDVNPQGVAQLFHWEKVYTTRMGFFGYSEHALINRKVVAYRDFGDFTFIREGKVSSEYLNGIDKSKEQELNHTFKKLVANLPEQVDRFSLNRKLFLLGDFLDELEIIENVIHAEARNYLNEVEQTVAQYSEDQEQLLNALVEIDPPYSVVSLNQNSENQFYCVLFGNLSYPRPLVMPKVKKIFSDFNKVKDDVGGSLSYKRRDKGMVSYTGVISTGGIASLFQSSVNAFFSEYMSAEGSKRLKSDFVAPGDGDPRRDEVIIENIFWDFMKVFDQSNMQANDVRFD